MSSFALQWNIGLGPTEALGEMIMSEVIISCLVCYNTAIRFAV